MPSDPVRFSNLKHIARSPSHYHHAATVGRDDKPWLRGGRGLHCVLFNQPYVVFDGASRNSKEWNRFIADREFMTFHKENRDSCPPTLLEVVDLHYPKAEIILAKELDDYKRMADAIRSELARQGMSHLLDGDTERPIEWEWLGRKCRSTPDVARRTTITDVKTTCNADPRKFHWDARKFFYAEQLRFYERAVQFRDDAGDPFTRELYDIAVEKTAPFPVVIWQVTDRMREQAEKTLRLWFEQLLACEASNVWPGYAQTVQQLDVLEDSGLTLTIGGEESEVE